MSPWPATGQQTSARLTLVGSIRPPQSLRYSSAGAGEIHESLIFLSAAMEIPLSLIHFPPGPMGMAQTRPQK